MDSSHPSIQSFFKREIRALPTPSNIPSSSPPAANPSSPSRPGDGFTADELAAAQDPLKCVFNPTRPYEKRDIAALETGPHAVTFVGRVVNFTVTFGKSKSQGAARGWVNMVLRDETGAIAVKLYFASQPYTLTLGALLTIWTPFISTATSVTKDPTYLHPSTPLSTSIFPGRDSSVHLLHHTTPTTTSLLRLPLSFSPHTPLPNLMTLQSFLSGGHDVPDCKVLLAVKSIGARKAIPSKKDRSIAIDLVEVVLFDDTADIVLKLWREPAASARAWRASETILLLTRPVLKDELWGRKPSLGLSHASMIDVDPSDEWQDARWLRKWLGERRKRESLKQVVPEGVWDVEAAENGVNRILFTLADIDEWVRSDPRQVFTGWLSLVVLEMSLALMRQRGMLMVSECCGIPIYANTPTIACAHCGTPHILSLNPRIIGRLIDETGVVAPGKLLWTPKAWEELFGRSVQELVALETGEVRALEQRVVGLRFSFCVGWEEGVGRLAVLGVRM